MTKSTQAKLSQTLLLLFLFTLFCCLNGCGPEGGGESSSTENTITLTATDTEVPFRDMSLITATVRNEDGEELTGLNVSFGFDRNSSGATLRVVSGKTDASGTAVATYTAGNNSPDLTVQDIIIASVTGSARTLVISRVPDEQTGNRISLAADPDALTTTSGTSIVTASVVRNDGTTPVAGETVTFSIGRGAGSISSLTDTTNNSGEANTIFTGPGGAATGEAIIRARLSTGGDVFAVITW